MVSAAGRSPGGEFGVGPEGEVGGDGEAVAGVAGAAFEEGDGALADQQRFARCSASCWGTSHTGQA
jgi:hypothetical protein